MPRQSTPLFASLLAVLFFVATSAYADCFLCLAHTASPPTIDFTGVDNGVKTRHFKPQYEFDSFGCYDLFLGKMVDCKFTYKLIGVDTNTDPLVGVGQNPFLDTLLGHSDPIFGGHNHDQVSHPFIYPDNLTGSVTFSNGANTSLNPLEVDGDTGGGFALFQFTVPQVAGALWVQTNIVTFEGYLCLVDCETHETISIGYGDFVPLGQQSTPADNPYITFRGDTTNHPNDFAFWGKPYTIENILSVADAYIDLYPNNTDVLSINDISLEYGGVFDVEADQTICTDPTTGNTVSCTWMPPHRTHRMGYEFDLNAATFNTQTGTNDPEVPCQVNKRVLAAVMERFKQLGSGAKYGQNHFQPIWLRCEDNSKGPLYGYHVNSYDPANLPPPGLRF